MYNKEELLNKVKGHITEDAEKLLLSLIDEADDFNKRDCNRFGEVYIDFDNVGNYSECDPFETFSLKIHRKVNKEINEIPVIESELSLQELNCSLCMLTEYFDEMDKVNADIELSLKNDNERLADTIIQSNNSGSIVYKDMEGYHAVRYGDFTRQPLDGQLYDINHLPEVILALKNEDRSKYDQAWVNDLALVNLCRYYYNKCATLEAELAKANDTIITNQIMR